MTLSSRSCVRGRLINAAPVSFLVCEMRVLAAPGFGALARIQRHDVTRGLRAGLALLLSPR